MNDNIIMIDDDLQNEGHNNNNNNNIEIFVVDDDVSTHDGDTLQNPNDPPIYTGGYSCPYITYVHTAPGHRSHAAEVHGHNQVSVWGWGYPLQNNHPLYTVGGVFRSEWIRELNFPGSALSTRRAGWCVGCGFKLVNPRRERRVRYRLCNIESGAETYLNYFHYACSQSHVSKYTCMRYNAMKCLYHPDTLRWGVSSNQGYHNNQYSFTYCEWVDLFVGLKLSGQLHVERKDWTLVRQYCFILILHNKTIEQMKRKYRTMKVNNRWERYFTPLFMETIIHVPVPIVPFALQI